ncbi:MAG: hypothetical protein ACWGHO_02000 [Candidatus Moraniibacteriota bacterium]
MKKTPKKDLHLFDMVISIKPHPKFVIGEIVGMRFSLDLESEPFLHIQDLLSGKDDIKVLPTDVSRIDIAKIHKTLIYC